MPKYHPSINSFLTPLLGLYGINIKDFVSDFEEKTKFIDFDVVIPLRVKISKIKTFEILVRTPYISNILQNIQSFTILQLYKIYLLKSTNVNSLSINDLNENSFLNLRQYASTLNKEFTIPKKIVSNHSEIESIHTKSKAVNFFKNKSANGIVFIFNNSSGQYLNQIRKAINYYGAKFSKINSYCSNSYYGNSFFISIFSTNTFTLLINHFLKLKSLSNLFISSFLINNQIVSRTFVKTFVKELTIFNNIQLIRFIQRFLQTLQLLNFNNTKLNRIIANISSINQ